MISILLVLFLKIYFVSASPEVLAPSIKYCSSSQMQGQCKELPLQGPDCIELEIDKLSPRSMQTFSCVMAYTESNCTGYSRKVEGEQTFPIVGHDNHFGRISYEIKSARACEGKTAGNSLYAYIYEGDIPDGDPIAEFEKVCGCKNLNESFWRKELSLENNGNCVKIYTEPNCKGDSETIPPGYSPLFQPLYVIVRDSNGEIDWMNYVIKSFEPCEVQENCGVDPTTPSPISPEPITTVDTVDPMNNLLLPILLPTLAGLVLLLFLYLNWKIRQQSRKAGNISKEEADLMLNGRPNELETKNEEEFAHDFAEYLSYDPNFELTSEQLEINQNELLGMGQFGIVYKGNVTKSSVEQINVAVKTVKENADISLFKSIICEIKIMIYLGSHPNIVNLVGAQTKNLRRKIVFMALEFCENNSLKKYLQVNRDTFNNVTDSEQTESDRDKKWNLSTLLRWSCQVANGMEFLCSKKVIHADLAARNVLLDENLTAKISDFGLSKRLSEYTSYFRTQESHLPWKWMAIECLQDLKFSAKSDVWAFGVLLFEIFSLDKQPYPGVSHNPDFVEAIVEGLRPTKPDFATNDIYKLMETTWNAKPEERPDFASLRKSLDDIYLELDIYSECIQ